MTPVQDEFAFNYTWKESDGDLFEKKILYGFKDWLTSTIPKCPIEVWQLNDTTTNALYDLTDITLDAELNEIQISTSNNMHKEIAVSARTSASENYKIVKVDICGQQEVTLTDDGPQVYTIDLEIGGTQNLVTLADLSSI